MPDRSLEDFLGDDGDSDDQPGNGDGEPPAAADTTDDSGTDGSTEQPPSVEPAVSTYDWTPTGAECGNCGAVVERRWRDGTDGPLVCADCKPW
jgi:hypothetical protein